MPEKTKNPRYLNSVAFSFCCLPLAGLQLRVAENHVVQVGADVLVVHHHYAITSFLLFLQVETYYDIIRF